MSRILLVTFFTSAIWVTTPALAETPNLQPGMWSHTTTTSVEGPMSMAPQSTTSQQCLTQEQVDKGVDMLEIPKQCSVTKMNVMRDTADFALTCNIQGMPMAFIGHSAFHGDNMNGQMSSKVDTPVGKMLMSMDFTAKRIGECP